jgi:ketosteroid isomerase-like protein
MKYLFAIPSLFLLSAITFAQKPASPLKTMVETEQAFSKTAEEKSTREAFLAFIAEDGLLFRPGAVNGKQWMLAHPDPPSDKHPLLAWQPAFADMSSAGDLGFTTGPWEFKKDIKDEKPAGYGHFVTLWKKQADGSWKFVVDLGISHPDSGGPLKIWQVSDSGPAKEVRSVDVEKTKKALEDRDRDYSATSAKLGLEKAFATFAAPEVRLYRNEKLPFIGRDEALKALAASKGELTSHASSVDVSRSGDLGYTVGTYEFKSTVAEKPVTEKGSYLRIWKNQNGIWRIVLEVTNPIH